MDGTLTHEPMHFPSITGPNDVVEPQANTRHVSMRSSLFSITREEKSGGRLTGSPASSSSPTQVRRAKENRGWLLIPSLSVYREQISNLVDNRKTPSLPVTYADSTDRLRGSSRFGKHTLSSENRPEKHSITVPVEPPLVHLQLRDKYVQLRPDLSGSTLTLQQCCAAPVHRPTKRSTKMGLTKTQRIGILLAIDSAFFLLELTIGYAVHSLALVADAFHMLNDVLSLCVGLWAVRVAQSGSSKMYTYGWQRAETLGALVNGVFLVALCVTIFLEAIQRFVDKPNVTNPKLVLIVGCLGLASNIIGLVLFHDVGHSHAHGEDEHSHAEEGHVHSHDEHSHAHAHAHADHDHSVHERSPLVVNEQQKSKQDKGFDSAAPILPRKSISAESTRQRRRTSVFASVDDRPVHPAYLRQDVIQAARNQEAIFDEDDEDEDDDSRHHDHGPGKAHGHAHTYGTTVTRKSTHAGHNHTQPKEAKSSGGHGHSHGDLNMRGVFLHVLGDALGNIGVIATALIIWLTTFPGRFYFDPAISIVITIIILTSAIPLCKAASRILLQAVPMGISIDEIRADVEDLPQVVEAHHVHVWQLSDTKLVASLHVKVDTEIQGAGSARYMKLARDIRACLHGYGIHSSTIQPEFLQKIDEHSTGSPGSSGDTAVAPGAGSKAGSLISADGVARGEGCMLDCEHDCGSKGQCCPSTDGVGHR